MAEKNTSRHGSVKGGTKKSTKTTSLTLHVPDITDDNKLLEEIVVKFGVESVSNPTQRALCWDEITKTFNSLSSTLLGKTMTKDQVRRKWNNMKKVTRKKWESNEPVIHQREPENRENLAVYEVIRQEEDSASGFTAATLIILDHTDKQQLAAAPSTDRMPLGAQVSVVTEVDGKGSDGEEEEEEPSGDEKSKPDKKKIRKFSDEEKIFTSLAETLTEQDEIHAKKRIRWEKRFRTEEANFLKKKSEIEAKTKEYQETFNQIERLNSELQQKIFDKKLDMEVAEEELARLNEILTKASTIEMYS